MHYQMVRILSLVFLLGAVGISYASQGSSGAGSEKIVLAGSRPDGALGGFFVHDKEAKQEAAFIQEITQGAEFVSKTPIAKVFDDVQQHKELAGERVVVPLIECLNSTKDCIKQKASVALVALGMTYGLYSSHYEQWTKQINSKNFFALEIAPDGSRVFPLGRFADEASMAYIMQPPLKTSLPGQHKTITEDWLFLEGNGEVALRDQGHQQRWVVAPVKPGSHLTVRAKTSFQFRSTSQEPLKFVLITRPPWPGNDEALMVPGYWERTHIALPADKFNFMRHASFVAKSLSTRDPQKVLYAKLQELAPKRKIETVEFVVENSDKLFLSETEVENPQTGSADVHFVLNDVVYKDHIVGKQVQPDGIVRIAVTKGFFELSEGISKENPKIDLLKTIIKIRLNEADAESSKDEKAELLGVYSALSLFAHIKGKQATGITQKGRIDYAFAQLKNTRLDPSAVALGCDPLILGTILDTL
jgi:mannose-6-phosphate isomerase-like protein (cupin superfamily)